MSALDLWPHLLPLLAKTATAVAVVAAALPRRVVLYGAACAATGIALKLAVDTAEMMRPPKFVDLSTPSRRRQCAAALRAANKPATTTAAAGAALPAPTTTTSPPPPPPPLPLPLQQEKRPLDDAILHVLLFRWQILGVQSKAFGNVLRAINRNYDAWDLPFAARGLDPATEVLAYCTRYGIPHPSNTADADASDEDPAWPWSKPPSAYNTMNEFFARVHAPGRLMAMSSPGARRRRRRRRVGDVLAPATAVVTVFPSVAAMPRLVKNHSFSIEGVVPEHARYVAHPCCLHYLSPADYHCFHFPCGGRIVTLDTQCGPDAPHSVTVKPYVFAYINILRRNRRAVVVVERDDGLRCAMVVIGGVTVDSIRLEAGLRTGATVVRGQKCGAFARGGSSVALFFSRPVALARPARTLLAHRPGCGFKLACCDILCSTETGTGEEEDDDDDDDDEMRRRRKEEE